MQILEWSSQSLDFKKAVHASKPSSVAKLKKNWTEDRPTIFPQLRNTRCQRENGGLQLLLVMVGQAVIRFNGASTVFIQGQDFLCLLEHLKCIWGKSGAL